MVVYILLKPPFEWFLPSSLSSVFNWFYLVVLYISVEVVREFRLCWERGPDSVFFVFPRPGFYAGNEHLVQHLLLSVVFSVGPFGDLGSCKFPILSFPVLEDFVHFLSLVPQEFAHCLHCGGLCDADTQSAAYLL